MINSLFFSSFINFSIESARSSSVGRMVVLRAKNSSLDSAVEGGDNVNVLPERAGLAVVDLAKILIGALKKKDILHIFNFVKKTEKLPCGPNSRFKWSSCTTRPKKTQNGIFRCRQ